jgi:hypothetical protein
LQVDQTAGDNNAREVVRFESVTERERSRARLSLGRSPSKMATQLIHPADDDESGKSLFHFLLLTLLLKTSFALRSSSLPVQGVRKVLAFFRRLFRISFQTFSTIFIDDFVGLFIFYRLVYSFL